MGFQVETLGAEIGFEEKGGRDFKFSGWACASTPLNPSVHY